MHNHIFYFGMFQEDFNFMSKMAHLPSRVNLTISLHVYCTPSYGLQRKDVDASLYLLFPSEEVPGCRLRGSDKLTLRSTNGIKVRALVI